MLRVVGVYGWSRSSRSGGVLGSKGWWGLMSENLDVVGSWGGGGKGVGAVTDLGVVGV